MSPGERGHVVKADRREGRGPRSLESSLGRVVTSLGGGSGASLVTLTTRWEQIVGPTVAEHASPRGLRDGLMQIAVEQSGWATQLRFLEPEVVARCDELLGAGIVTAIDVRVAPLR